jgi:NAD/NADP transhydrogenase beta subunit
MNRSIKHVLIGGFGEGSGGPKKKAKKTEGTVREVTCEDVVDMMTDAKSIIIVPGYGMAVAKAQHAIATMTTKLRSRGINVRFGIHPVAGRLPGHMNVSMQCIFVRASQAMYTSTNTITVNLVFAGPPRRSSRTVRYHPRNG